MQPSLVHFSTFALSSPLNYGIDRCYLFVVTFKTNEARKISQKCLHPPQAHHIASEIRSIIVSRRRDRSTPANSSSLHLSHPLVSFFSGPSTSSRRARQTKGGSIYTPKVQVSSKPSVLLQTEASTTKARRRKSTKTNTEHMRALTCSTHQNKQASFPNLQPGLNVGVLATAA